MESFHLVSFPGDSNKLIYSEVAFDRDQVNTSSSPCSDFFIRSLLQHQQVNGLKSNLGDTSALFSPASTFSLTSLSSLSSSSSSLSMLSSSSRDRDHHYHHRSSGKNSQAVSENSPQTLESAVLLNLTLVFLWKAYVVQESGQMNIVVGQHHVHVKRLNTGAMSYPLPPVNMRASGGKPQLKFIRSSGEDITAAALGPEVTTKLVTYSFSHCHQLEFCFSKGLCVIPVTLTVQNHTDREVKVIMDTSKLPDSLSNPVAITAANASNSSSNTTNANSNQPDSTHAEGTSTSLPTGAPTSTPAVHHQSPSSHTTSNVRWVGMTQASLTLAKGQNYRIHLKAGLTRPGTYNLNCLSLFVTYSTDQSQMILQKHTTPSIVTVVDTSTSSSVLSSS